MADNDNIEKPVDNVPKKRGRKPSGLPLKTVQQQSTKKRFERLKSQGKVQMEVFVEKNTKIQIQALKKPLDVKTQGEVIEILVAAEILRRKIK